MNAGDLDFEFSEEEDDDVSDGTISDLDSGSDSEEESCRFVFFSSFSFRLMCNKVLYH